MAIVDWLGWNNNIIRFHTFWFCKNYILNFVIHHLLELEWPMIRIKLTSMLEMGWRKSSAKTFIRIPFCGLIVWKHLESYMGYFFFFFSSFTPTEYMLKCLNYQKWVVYFSSFTYPVDFPRLKHILLEKKNNTLHT